MLNGENPGVERLVFYTNVQDHYSKPCPALDMNSTHTRLSLRVRYLGILPLLRRFNRSTTREVI